MPSTLYNGSVLSGSNVIFGASGGGGSLAANATLDTGSSLSILTTASNTRWLVEVDADISWAVGINVPDNTHVQAKVNGSYVATTGGFDISQASNAGYEITECTIRGRCVVTLAAATTHTILAAVSNGAGGVVVVSQVAITATMLSG